MQTQYTVIPKAQFFDCPTGLTVLFVPGSDFECNCGSDLMKCDRIFGTYRKDSPEVTKVATAFGPGESIM